MILLVIEYIEGTNLKFAFHQLAAGVKKCLLSKVICEHVTMMNRQQVGDKQILHFAIIDNLTRQAINERRFQKVWMDTDNGELKFNNG